MEKEFRLMAAPLQGLTEAAWRREHFLLFGEKQGDVEYFTPFIRMEKGAVRARDLREFTSDLNKGMMLTPQIIFKDVEEWKLLVDTLIEAGSERIDLNMGCPFVPQVKKGRGAGMLCFPDKVTQIAEEMMHYPDIRFSVKMRLGIDDPGEALALADILNSMTLRHVTIHPRTAKQQYKGNLLLSEMKDFASRLQHPVIFNGEVTTPSDIGGLISDYDGVMVGRGLLTRPSLFAEYRSGSELPIKQQEDAFISLIRNTHSVLEDKLCGSTQIKNKMKPYWEYAPASLDKKIVKLGKKTGDVFF